MRTNKRVHVSAAADSEIIQMGAWRLIKMYSIINLAVFN